MMPVMFIPCICPGMMQRAHFLDDAAMLMYEMPDSAMVLVEKKEPRLAGILSAGKSAADSVTNAVFSYYRKHGSRDEKFGPTHRWGNFPSFSAGWKISEEPFFKKWKQDWFSSLKPRVSWGILGNDTALASYSYLASFSNVTLHSFDGSSAVAGYNNAKVINEDIRWESIQTLDVGLPTAYIYGGGGNPFTGTSPCKTVNGMPISSFWGLRTDGMITSQAEIDELNATARAKGHEYYHQRLTGVGDLKFVDLNGDGTIDDNDRTFC